MIRTTALSLPCWERSHAVRCAQLCAQAPQTCGVRTAHWIAAVRARESARTDRLFDDPYAHVLAGPDGHASMARSERAATCSTPRWPRCRPRQRDRRGGRPRPGPSAAAVRGSGRVGRRWAVLLPRRIVHCGPAAAHRRSQPGRRHVPGRRDGRDRAVRSGDAAVPGLVRRTGNPPPFGCDDAVSLFERGGWRLVSARRTPTSAAYGRCRPG